MEPDCDALAPLRVRVRIQGHSHVG